jgi:hypothetical protein
MEIDARNEYGLVVRGNSISDVAQRFQILLRNILTLSTQLLRSCKLMNTDCGCYISKVVLKSGAPIL